MKAFYDATCEKCGKRIGWFGELKDRPPCPKCEQKRKTHPYHVWGKDGFCVNCRASKGARPECHGC